MIYVIGIGPGGHDSITPRALKALKSCEIIAGYTKYIDLVRDILPGKCFIAYSMRQEILRCQEVLNLSRGKNINIALISSGDSGVYGMAGLMLETARDSGQEVIIIPGMTAANSAAAVLGAPLMNDYVNISLSDLMTPWKIIEKRLIAACTGDFVICLYNPASNNRPENFRRACKILLDYKSPSTPAGFVMNSDRENEYHEIMTLSQIQDCKLINMSCTVIIGNSQSYILDGKIITPRGYKIFQTC
ncbi:MAG: precorrin-3B C(17)-methyltransferase [Synergistaceae bacterium]|nr:precorrin-3B C(17)-methyltransferase [Synergistaceae bacterium]